MELSDKLAAIKRLRTIKNYRKKKTKLANTPPSNFNSTANVKVRITLILSIVFSEKSEFEADLTR